MALQHLRTFNLSVNNYAIIVKASHIVLRRVLHRWVNIIIDSCFWKRSVTRIITDSVTLYITRSRVAKTYLRLQIPIVPERTIIIVIISEIIQSWIHGICWHESFSLIVVGVAFSLIGQHHIIKLLLRLMIS
jgi:hypothetical protein